MAENLQNLGTSEEFFDLVAKSLNHISKNQLIRLYRNENFCERSFKRMKRQATDKEDNFANNLNDKRLISRIFSKLSKFNIKKFY